ncbi:hypothetical protein O3M35_009675 [Rhynocoris fuscipes]|uniref:Cytochrome P450 n=1 Tax=Rhynocoris fuscipes TaxID=488301 RepID=A0AAW1D4L1_9HEMI
MLSITTLISTAIILLIFSNFTKIIKFIRRFYLYQKLPGIRIAVSTKFMFKLLKIKENELFDTLQKLFEASTETVSAMMFFRFYTAIMRPKALEKLLTSNVNITKGDQYNAVKKWLNEGLLTSGGEKWRRRRKILTPTFHFKILQDSLHVINRNAQILSEKFSKTGGAIFEIENYVTLCTLDIICETAMGVKLDFQKDKAVEYVQDIKRACQILIKKEVTFWLQSDLIFRFTSYYSELKQIIGRLHAFTDKVIANRKVAFQKLKEQNKLNEDKKRMAFLDCLIDTELKEPGTFTDLDMREEVDTFMFEGHDTTATAITFCLLVLAGEKAVQEKVVEELNRIFGESDRPVTTEDLHEMKYLEMVIKETLRLFPSVPYISRYSTEDLVLEDGTIIPEGTNLGIFIYVTHRHADFYPNPLNFDPERFNEENSKKRIPFSYIPFSAGPRNCIGQKFAMMELKTIISTILRNNRLESVTNWKELKLIPRIVLKPDKPIKIRFFSRKNESVSK